MNPGYISRSFHSEDISAFAVSSDPERRSAAPKRFVTGEEDPLIAKIITTDQVFRSSTERAMVGHIFPEGYKKFLRFMQQSQKKLVFFASLEEEHNSQHSDD